MEFTAAASWLNSFFAGFDNGILEFMHTLETSAGTVLTPLAKLLATGAGIEPNDKLLVFTKTDDVVKVKEYFS